MAESLWASFNKVDPWKEDEFAFCHHHNVSYNHRVNDEGGSALQQSVKALVACFETMHTSHACTLHVLRFFVDSLTACVCRSFQLVRSPRQGL